MNITLTRRSAARRHFDARRCWHEEKPAGLLPAPEKHKNANLALSRQLALEASGVSCPLIRATYIERIAEALGA